MITASTVKTRAAGVYDDPRAWSQPAPPPLSDAEVKAVQDEIDSICGVTRDSKSIAKLVWNGDRKYWKKVCVDWTIEGEPREFIRRPIVLARSVYSPHGKLVRDEYPPRWLVLTRIEPEQYAASWGRDSRVYLPERRQWVQIRPTEAPKDWHVWFMTVAEHDPYCCEQAAREDRSCYGRYAHPRMCLDELRRVRKGIEEAGLPAATPFDSPDRVTAKMRDASVNNYVEQAAKRYETAVSRFAGELPQGRLQRIVADNAARDIDEMLKRQK